MRPALPVPGYGAVAFSRRCGHALALLFALLLTSASAQTSAPLSVTLTMHDYPPFIGHDLPYGGLLTRIVTEAFKAANVNVQLEQVSSNRAITGVMMGMYDGAFGWAHTPDRDRKLLYSKSSIYTFRMVFFQRRNMEVNWNTLTDLKPYQIGTTLGDHYSEELTDLHARHVLQVQEAASDLNNMRKLLLGRIDLFPIEEEAGKALIQTMLTPREQARLSYQTRPLATVPTYLVLRRDLPHAQELLDRFDQGFRQLNESGQLAHILAEAHRSNMGLVQQASQKDTVH